MNEHTTSATNSISTASPTERTRSNPGLGSTRGNPFDAAPFYRKRWMVVVSALLFIPVTMVILLSGPVYQNDGDVWDQKQRVTTAIALFAFMAFTFLRLST